MEGPGHERCWWPNQRCYRSLCGYTAYQGFTPPHGRSHLKWHIASRLPKTCCLAGCRKPLLEDLLKIPIWKYCSLWIVCLFLCRQMSYYFVFVIKNPSVC